MAVLTERPSRETPKGSTRERRKLIGPVVLALLGSAAIFVFGTPYFEIYESTNDDPIFNGALTIGAGILAWTMRHRNDAYEAVSSALFVTAAAMWSLVIGPFNWVITAETNTVEEAFQDKVAQFLAVVPVVLVLVWLTGRSRQSLYLGKGDISRWLRLGPTSLVLWAAAITLIAIVGGASLDEISDLAPWVVGFALLNAVMEELWFRSISLHPYVEHLGVSVGIGVTAVVFGLAHVEATYMSNATQLPFALLVVALGVLLAWITRWSKSIWGAVLFHAGMDFVILFEFL